MNNSFDTFVNQFTASASTIKGYRDSLELFGRFLGDIEPTEAKVKEFQVRLENSGRKPATINRHLAPIRAYFHWMKNQLPPEKREWDLEVKGTKLQNKPIKRISPKDVLNIIACAETPYEKALTMTLYDGALKIKELMGLRVEDVDFKKKQLRIKLNHGNETELVTLKENTLQGLKKFIGEGHGQLFSQPYYQINYDLKRMGNRVGIRRVNASQFRYARALDLWDNKVDPWDAMRFMRIKNISTMMRYYQQNSSGSKSTTIQ